MTGVGFEPTTYGLKERHLVPSLNAARQHSFNVNDAASASSVPAQHH